MREFAKFEQIKAKCPVCGCRNKVLTPLYKSEEDVGVITYEYNKKTPKDLRVGYSLKCCNCGNYNKFVTDNKSNGEPIPDREHLVAGKSECIQLSYCKSGKECPLYGSCEYEINKEPDVVPKEPEVRNLQDNIIRAVVDVLDPPKFL